MCMAAAAPAGGDAVFSGCTVEFLYTTDPDRVIDAVFGDVASQVSYVRGNGISDVRNGKQKGPVRQWAFAGLQASSLGGGDISVTARLNEIRLVSSAEGDGCVSPMAYLEAKRTTALEPVTGQSLDSQLKGIDPAILKLRPRFALTTP